LLVALGARRTGLAVRVRDEVLIDGVGGGVWDLCPVVAIHAVIAVRIDHLGQVLREGVHELGEQLCCVFVEILGWQNEVNVGDVDWSVRRFRQQILELQRILAGVFERHAAHREQADERQKTDPEDPEERRAHVSLQDERPGPCTSTSAGCRWAQSPL
jgi:hypothetical protein